MSATISVPVLTFFFLAAMALACILVLQALSRNDGVKVGYAALAITYILWVWKLFGMPAGLASWWLYALPILWLVLLFCYGFSGLGGHPHFRFTGEPHDTEEALRGEIGRREALTFYFLLLLIGLILGLVFFDMALLYH